MSQNTLRISPARLQEGLQLVFLKHGFSETKACILARIHTESTMDGINSHGINRVPLFIEYVKQGIVKPDAEARKDGEFGQMERWDGQEGPGILNALNCTSRAVDLAREHGMGLVALRNTNHWMRGGTYGWQAAQAGCISICFTNTKPNMPPWGGRDSRIGNNPLIVSIPRENGRHVVLDMALSQYSFGKIHDYQLKGKRLPFPGGWDEKDALSQDPEKILLRERGLPIGYWKGSALSMILDMLATLLSAGNSTRAISAKDYETGISQVFLCMDPGVFSDREVQERLLEEIIEYTRDVEPMQEGERSYYPGERTWLNRERNKKEGIQVSPAIWKQILDLAKLQKD